MKEKVMNTVLFDLDGTLLPMDQEIFINSYMEAIARKIAPMGFEPKSLMKAIWIGTEDMVKNDGSMTNEERFWKIFADVLGKDIIEKKPYFDEFYKNEFKELGKIFTPNPMAAKCIDTLKEKGYTLAAATNPLFPRAATLARMEWARVNPESFELITSYEKSCFCKPNLNYYREVLDKLGKKPEECMMVGNDVAEDMCVSELGIDTYLLTDTLINKDEKDVSQFKNGDFAALYDYLKLLPEV